MSLTEAQEMLLMAYADGELAGDPAQLAEAEALLSAQDVARHAVHDLQVGATALRDYVMSDALAAGVDVSRVRGRVMTRLPAETRAPVARAEPTLFDKLFGWTRALGTGQLGLAGGVAMAAIMFAMVLSHDQVTDVRDLHDGVDATVAPAAAPQVAKEASADDAEPEVIIEDMELDGGTVLIEGAEEPGEPMIIWHIQPDEGEAG